MGNTYTLLGHEDIIKPFTINAAHLAKVLAAKAEENNLIEHAEQQPLKETAKIPW